MIETMPERGEPVADSLQVAQVRCGRRRVPHELATRVDDNVFGVCWEAMREATRSTTDTESTPPSRARSMVRRRKLSHSSRSSFVMSHDIGSLPKHWLAGVDQEHL